MNILYVSNEKYTKYLAISLLSLLENQKISKKSENIHIFIISIGISTSSKEKLKQICRRYHYPSLYSKNEKRWRGYTKLYRKYQEREKKVELTFLELEDLQKYFEYTLDTGRFDISIMGRLFLGELLPPEIERIIYLDCDTLVNGSLLPLWKIDLHGKTLGAVLEPTIDIQTKVDIGLHIADPYFNSGVLLIDVRAWRERQILQRILAYYQSIGKYSLFGDQDAINGALRWEIQILPPRFNFFTNYYYWSYKELIKMSALYKLIPYKEYQRAKNQPVIIHFAGDERPWLRGNWNPFRKCYQKYQKQISWGGLESGKELYLLAYHIMNVLTMICPMARKQISNWYMQRQRRKKYENSSHYLKLQ